MKSQDYSVLRPGFEASGFAHLEGFLSPQELSDVRARLDRYIAEVVPKLESYRALYDVEDGQRSIKQLNDMQIEDAELAELANGAKFKGLAAALLGEDVTLKTVEYFDKAPRFGKPTPPHQDGFYFCIKPNRAVTMWIALDDCDPENGCMSYVKGSHKRGVIDHKPSGVVGFSQGLEGVSARPEETFVAQGKAGDCFVHHSLTIHMAGPNRSARHRRSLGLIYYGVSAQRDEEASARYEASVAAQRKQYSAAATA